MMDDSPAWNALRVDEADVPLHALMQPGRQCLCVIRGIEGPSYRPVGAAMVVDEAGKRTGSLSSGCIDADVALHARNALQMRRGCLLRYGRGSPFIDLQLPCGGALEVLLLPEPDTTVIAEALRQLSYRQEAHLILHDNGSLSDDAFGGGLHLRLVPRLRIIALGTGPEPRAFAAIAAAAGQETVLLASDSSGSRSLRSSGWPEHVPLDARTAVAMFFHDHRREPVLLEHALLSPAFYVGAQGSARARATRIAALKDLGVPDDRIARMATLFGTITRARDPNTLAIGVLAQIMDAARNQQGSFRTVHEPEG